MSDTLAPRVVKAGNRGPFTLDGTRSFLVGKDTAVVIDPGPDVEEHVRALCLALTPNRDLKILVTHGHSDHAGAASALSELLAAPLFGPPSVNGRELSEGDRIPTDEGHLVTITIPGHTRDHLGFFWPEASAFFAGDLVLGRGTTTWLGEYPGCVADYLVSLNRVLELEPRIIYPAHGPPIKAPAKTLEAFRNHRLGRLEQLQEVLRSHPRASVEEMVRQVYGAEVPDRLINAARSSIEVMLFHLEVG